MQCGANGCGLVLQRYDLQAESSLSFPLLKVRRQPSRGVRGGVLHILNLKGTRCLLACASESWKGCSGSRVCCGAEQKKKKQHLTFLGVKGVQEKLCG